MTDTDTHKVLQKLLDVAYKIRADPSIQLYKTIKTIIPEVVNGKIPVDNYMDLIDKLESDGSINQELKDDFRNNLGKN